MTEKKEYRSALRSRRMIRDAFLSLLREKSFEKITVTDIVNRADINRSTFYAHYPDVRGLLDSFVQKTLDESMELIRNTTFSHMLKEPKSFISDLIHIGEENIDLYRLIGNSDFALRQVESIKRSLQEKAMNAEEIPAYIRSSPAFQIQVAFFVGGILNIFQLQMQGTLNCTAEQITEQLAHMIKNNSEMYRDGKL